MQNKKIIIIGFFIHLKGIVITTEVTRSLQSRIIIDILYTISWFFPRKSSIPFVTSCPIEKNWWTKNIAPADEINALLRYSWKDGV